MSDPKRDDGRTPGPEAGTPAFAPKPDLRERVIEVLQSCYDPEIPVNIYELGLVYGVDVTPEGKVAVTMTLTSPACPVAGSLPIEVEAKVRALDGVSDARVDVVWDPPWTPEKMSELAKLQLNMM
jgi:FeS assembly SUF system protein